ncbi:MAG: hypothetical protein BWY56_01281 [Acidobacteria bacterium ADurb.Bin340]|nr:MAG: hypothetical protein BWY56_01281 [Acidobacteria bacterium ADurb.Bin340]HQL47701.1 hypothetical protein [Holophaga sp.]
MRSIALFGAVPCLLCAQAGPVPLTFQDLQARARPAPALNRAEAALASQRLRLQETRGGLREGPTLGYEAGPRRAPVGPSTTDQALEVDLPLIFAPGVRRRLEQRLGAAHPLMREAARREDALQLRIAYLDAWRAERLLALRTADLATVEAWRKVARMRVAEGADPAFQAALVEGELMKARLEASEARADQARAWSALRRWADLPPEPLPLAEPDPLPTSPLPEVEVLRDRSPLFQALRAETELDLQALRLEEAQARARWSLRGAYAREGDEKVARLGLALRLPRPGENAALRREAEARARVRADEAALGERELEARLQAVLARWDGPEPEPAPPDFTQALQAVALRLSEGRERPSEALPLRRQLLEGQVATLQHQHRRACDAAELQAFLPEVTR